MSKLTGLAIVTIVFWLPTFTIKSLMLDYSSDVFLICWLAVVYGMLLFNKDKV